MIIFCKDLLIRFKQDRCTQHAAALSFSSLLALAPVLAIAFALLSVFAPLESMGQNLENFIYQYLVPDAGLDIRQYLTYFTKQTGKLTTVGLFTFLLTAVFLLYNIEELLNCYLENYCQTKVSTAIPDLLGITDFRLDFNVGWFVAIYLRIIFKCIK